MINLKIGGIIVAAFIAGAFIASPELRAYAANTIGSSDIIDESILSQDIKNGQVMNGDIANGAISNSKLASNSVTFSKIAPGSIDSSKIVDQSIKSNDIAADAVGASEIKGASKLNFATCSTTASSVDADAIFSLYCDLPGVVSTDHIVGSQNSNICLAITSITPSTDRIYFEFHNACRQAMIDIGTMEFSLMIFQN